MGAGFTHRIWDVKDIVALVEAAEAPPKKRGPYKPCTPKPAAIRHETLPALAVG